MRRLTNRNWGVSMGYQLFKVSQYLRGWINCFGIANAYQTCVELDHWLRRRVRMCYSTAELENTGYSTSIE